MEFLSTWELVLVLSYNTSLICSTFLGSAQTGSEISGSDSKKNKREIFGIFIPGGRKDVSVFITLFPSSPPVSFLILTN